MMLLCVKNLPELYNYLHYVIDYIFVYLTLLILWYKTGLDLFRLVYILLAHVSLEFSGIRLILYISEHFSLVREIEKRY